MHRSLTAEAIELAQSNARVLSSARGATADPASTPLRLPRHSAGDIAIEAALEGRRALQAQQWSPRSTEALLAADPLPPLLRDPNDRSLDELQTQGQDEANNLGSQTKSAADPGTRTSDDSGQDAKQDGSSLLGLSNSLPSRQFSGEEPPTANDSSQISIDTQNNPVINSELTPANPSMLPNGRRDNYADTSSFEISDKTYSAVGEMGKAAIDYSASFLDFQDKLKHSRALEYSAKGLDALSKGIDIYTAARESNSPTEFEKKLIGTGMKNYAATQVGEFALALGATPAVAAGWAIASGVLLDVGADILSSSNVVSKTWSKVEQTLGKGYDDLERQIYNLTRQYDQF